METKKLGILWIAFGVVFTLAAALFASSTRGQRRPSEELVLAQITIHEAGWDDLGDAEAIDAVLRNGAAREAISYRAFARAYSGRIWTGETSKRWVRHLDESCNAPAEWPAATVRRGIDSATGEETYVRVPHAPWRTYRERCLAVMERAREIRSGVRTHHCTSEPHDWGGVVDHERAARLGLIPIDCSAEGVEPRNTFYARPSLVRRAL